MLGTIIRLPVVFVLNNLDTVSNLLRGIDVVTLTEIWLQVLKLTVDENRALQTLRPVLQLFEIFHISKVDLDHTSRRVKHSHNSGIRDARFESLPVECDHLVDPPDLLRGLRRQLSLVSWLLRLLMLLLD